MAPTTQTQPNPMALARQRLSGILLSDEAKQQIMPLLPVGVALQQVVSEVNRAVAENPDILECTPVSIVMAVSTAVKWDLEIGYTVHLVPFTVKGEKRLKALRDYKGDIELVVRSGAARKVDAKCRYEKEHFIHHEGTTPYIEHHPIGDPAARGKMVGAYAYAKLPHNEIKIAYLSVAEIDEIRRSKSKTWKDGELQPWYACKTMVHQVTKAIPKNPNLAPILREFEREEKEEEIPEGEFEVVSETPAAAPPSPTDPATEVQVTRLRELVADRRINEQTRTKVARRLERGLVYGLAATWIEGLELELRSKASDDDSDDLPLGRPA